MSLLPRLPLFAATLTLLSLALALVFLSGHPVPAAQAQTTTPTTTTTVDYDSNDDRLIEISTLAQLNAIRWDLNGDGAVATADQTNYAAAFPNAATGMGCPDGSDADTNPDPCLGYELKADLTFDSNGDGSITAADSAGLYWNNGAGWTPIGLRATGYTGQFQGRGKVISHLFINNNSTDAVGLFAAVGQGGQVVGLGLEEVSIASGSGSVAAGSLAGLNAGTITTSYARGALTTNAGTAASGDKAFAGGLVGVNFYGTVQASFAEVAVAATHNRAGIAGGLVGDNLLGEIKASYAAGAVAARGSNSRAGGLVGSNDRTITASYARGRVTAAGSGSAAGGLVGSSLRTATVTTSYWDTTASGQSGSAGGTGQTSRALQTPSGYNYSGIYVGWNVNLDGAAGGDSPWYFGGVNQYPLLVYGSMRDFPLWDYDADNDRLIEVNNLAQLNAIRWDLNTNGIAAEVRPYYYPNDAAKASDKANYITAFPGAVAGMGCAQGTTAAACAGYELMSDLDFDTDGDGSVDADDEFWNGGQGWNPIGVVGHTVENGIDKIWQWDFHGTFRGNDKTIANLYINHSHSASDRRHYSYGLFGFVGPTGVIDGVKLRDANIRIQQGAAVGSMVGWNWSGAIKGSSATGRITVFNTNYNDVGPGGLVGDNDGSITSSYANVEITGNPSQAGGLVGENEGSIIASYSGGAVISTIGNVGGLVGGNSGTITASYSRSPVKATGNNAVVGGLVGWNGRYTWHDTTHPDTITASYATGPVVATGANSTVGGLVGRNVRVDSSGRVYPNSKGTAVDSYWDIGVSGQSSSALGTGMRGTGPTAYTGIFANWNLNLDGVAGKDDPWHFAPRQYPMLKYGGLDVVNQVRLYVWDAPVVGRTAKTSWHIGDWLTRARGGYAWERSDDGVTGWTFVRNRQLGIGQVRGGHYTFLIEPYEANKRFRVSGNSAERGWISGYITPPATPWGGPTATLTFASGHTTPRVGQAIAISGSDNVRWIRCDDTADNGCDVIVRSATGYTPVAADQGKYLYAYRYYDNAQNVKTMGKTAVIGPVAAAAATP